ncbi:extracellular solute-binding protein [Kitasatospora sp. NPDC054939]
MRSAQLPCPIRSSYAISPPRGPPVPHPSPPPPTSRFVRFCRTVLPVHISYTIFAAVDLRRPLGRRAGAARAGRARPPPAEESRCLASPPRSCPRPPTRRSRRGSTSASSPATTGPRAGCAPGSPPCSPTGSSAASPTTSPWSPPSSRPTRCATAAPQPAPPSHCPARTAGPGRLYGAPLYFDVNVLLYRKDILQKYGFTDPPRTWDELKSTAAAISSRSAASGRKVAGWQFKGMDDHPNAINPTWESFLCQAGGSLTSPDFRTSTQNTDAGRTAMAYMKSFYTDRISTPGPSALGGFIEGEVAMFSFYQSVISDIAAGNQKTNGKWAVAPMPVGPKSGCSAVGGHSLVARAGLRDPGAAGTFMRWLASPERSTQFMEFHAIFPYDTAKVARGTKVVVDSFYHADPSWAAIMTQFDRSTPDLLLQNRHAFATRWEAQKSDVPAGIDGRTPVDQVLRGIDGKVDKALGAG